MGVSGAVPPWLPALLGLLLLALGHLHTQLWFTGAVLTQVLPSFERWPIRALELRMSLLALLSLSYLKTRITGPATEDMAGGEMTSGVCVVQPHLGT